MKKSMRPTCVGGTYPGDPNLEDQTLKEQAQEILRYLDSAHPAQTIVPPGRVDLLRRSLPRFGDIQKQINELAAFLLAEFPNDIQEGGAVDNAIRLLKGYKNAMRAIGEGLDIVKKEMEDRS